jgi:glutathione transport system permease protein
MLNHLIRRVLGLLPVFLVLSALIFLIIHLLPGDPIDNLLTIGSGPEARARIAAKYGLDQPLAVQYGVWLKNVLQGDFGTSILTRLPVATMIAQVMPNTLLLGGLAMLFSSVVGIILGVIASAFPERWPDQIIMGGVLLGSTLPEFWLGLVLILGFSVELGWFPVSGARGWESVVLPVLTIGLAGVALVTRVTRMAMVDVGRRDFVMMLHAKGLSPATIRVRILRHALIPVVTILALRIGWILGGAVTVEYVFARPGLGSMLIKALAQHDYPVVQACLLMLAIAVMLGTLLGDILQAVMDPRIRSVTK